MIQKLLLPGGDLIRMYLVFDRQLLDRLTFFERLKDDFSLKTVGKVSSFSFHSQQINILLFCCPIFLDHYKHLMRRDFKDAQEWKEFTYHACDEFDRIKESAMIHIINSYLAEIYRDQDYVFKK